MNSNIISHYLNFNLIQHINSLTISQAQIMKSQIIEDMNLRLLDANVKFLREVELEYINYKLEINN